MSEIQIGFTQEELDELAYCVHNKLSNVEIELADTARHNYMHPDALERLKELKLILRKLKNKLEEFEKQFQ